MDFKDTPEQAKFRKTCREWLENNATLKDASSSESSFANKDIIKEGNKP